MGKELTIDLILNKIIIFNKYILNYFDEKVMKLSPAGKYQIFLLSSSIVIQRLKVINIFQSNNIDTKMLTEKILITSHSVFDRFKKEYFDENDLYFHSNYLAKSKINSQNRIIFKKKRSTLDSDSLILMSIFSLEIDNKLSFSETYLNIIGYPFFSVDASESEQRDFKKIFFNSMRNNDPLELEQFDKKMKYLIENITDKLNEDSYFMSNMSKHQNNNPNCYIATLAYQDINHPKVEYLRNYRDNYLSNYLIGKYFIKYYYNYSPSVVEFLRPYKKINKLIKNILDILINILRSSR